MKHARKMVLVDINSVKTANPKTEESSLAEAINSLASKTEFSKANYGSSATAMSYVTKELK